MDEFGVLTERYGLKPQGKSAPMSAPRVDPLPAASSSSAASKSRFDSASSSYDLFGGNGGVSNANPSFDHFDSLFSSSKPSSADALGNDSYDIFGSFPSHSNQASFPKSPVGDLLGDFESPNPNPPSQTTHHSFDGLDDFAFSHKPSSSRNSNASEDPFAVLESSSNASSSKLDDPFLGFDARTSKPSSKLRPPPMPGNIIKSEKGSFIEEFQEFTSSKEPRRTPKATKYKEAEEPSKKFTQQDSSFDLLSSFNGPRSTSAPKSRVPTQDPFFDLDSTTNSSSSNDFFSHSSTKNSVDELYSILGDTSFFETTFTGESEERRKARVGRIKRTQDRMEKAVADMNNRDSKVQLEQEERRRIAEQMDVVIKRWATGKEGNLRSLLSSLHQVLWPESGWEAVSRSDVVSSSDVKKLFRKASLCVHPDKVQQKGSSLHERYIAEKVFDILKEAWNKFNRDER